MDKKPIKGVDIYNKQVWQSPLNGSIPFVDSRFDIRNMYNSMAAVKIKNENSFNRATTIAYQIDQFQGTSTAFNYFITKLVSTGFLVSDQMLLCDNASIHLTEDNKNLAEILWEEKKIPLLSLPP